MQRKHGRERQTMALIVKAEIAEEIDALKDEQRRIEREMREAFLIDCARLKEAQGVARAMLRTRWQEHNVARRAALTAAPVRGPRPERTRGMPRGRGLEPG